MTINEPAAAIKILRAEHAKLAESTMRLVDLIEEIQTGRQDVNRIHTGHLRQVSGHMLRRSGIEMEAAIAAVAPNRDAHEPAFGEFLLGVMTEAEDGRDDDIIELCRRRMPACIVEAVA